MMNSLCFRRSWRSLFLLSTLAAAAIAPAQKIVAWGQTTGEYAQRPSPASVIGVRGGIAHSLALYADGKVEAWGTNDYGQLDVPSGLSDAVDVSAGLYHSLALRANGTVVAWGQNALGQCNVPSGLAGVTAIGTGPYHSLAARADGKVAAWGWNDFGQCNVPPGLRSVVGVAGGWGHTLALRSNGTVKAWGLNENGQCDVPTSLKRVIQIVAGAFHSVALRADGTVTAWGSDKKGQTDVPVGLTGVVKIAAGGSQSIALRADGTVVVWGSNDEGQLNVPAGLSGVVAVGAGWYDFLAVVAAARAVLDMKEVVAGDAVQGKVELALASDTDTVVELVASDPSVHVPETVTIPAGQTEAAFPVTTDLVFGNDRDATVATRYQGTATIPAKLRVKATQAALVFSGGAVVGGSMMSRTLTLTLSNSVASDFTFPLLSSGPSVEVPETVTIPAGSTSVTVPVVHHAVGENANVVVDARYGGEVVANASLLVKSFTGSVTFDVPAVNGGETATGQIYVGATLRESLTFELTSDSDLASVPATVTIPAGSRRATITVATQPVASTQPVRISATALGKTFSGRFFVRPEAAVASASIPGPVYGKGSYPVTIRLKRPATAGGTLVRLRSSSSVIRLPESIMIPEGRTSFTVEARTSDIIPTATVTITAETAANSVSKVVTVRPNVIASLALSTQSVKGGISVTATVSMSGVVREDTKIALTSSSASAMVPASVTVRAGEKTATFTVSTVSVKKPVLLKIAAKRNSVGIAKTLRVKP